MASMASSSSLSSSSSSSSLLSSSLPSLSVLLYALSMTVCGAILLKHEELLFRYLYPLFATILDPFIRITVYGLISNDDEYLLNLFCLHITNIYHEHLFPTLLVMSAHCFDCSLDFPSFIFASLCLLTGYLFTGNIGHFPFTTRLNSSCAGGIFVVECGVV